MKKLLTIALVACMVATAAFCAFGVSAAAGDNLALNKSYTGGVATQVNGGTYSAKLTDGNAATELNFDDTWFGSYYNAEAADASHNTAQDGFGVIVIDLGAQSSMDTVRVNTFLGNSAGILAPKSMKVEVSTDGKTFTQFGETKTLTAPATNTDENAGLVDWVVFKADAVTAQYVKVTIEHASTWAFLNEIEVLEAEGASSGDTSKEESKTESKDETTSEAPAASSTAPATSSTSKPATGDAGMIVFAVLAVVAVAGAVVAVRVRH